MRFAQTAFSYCRPHHAPPLTEARIPSPHTSIHFIFSFFVRKQQARRGTKGVPLECGGGGPIGVKEDKSRSQRDTKKEVREDRSYSFKERYELLLLGADKGPSERHREWAPEPLRICPATAGAAATATAPLRRGRACPPTLCLRLWLAVPWTAAQTSLHFLASRTADSAP